MNWKCVRLALRSDAQVCRRFFVQIPDGATAEEIQLVSGRDMLAALDALPDGGEWEVLEPRSVEPSRVVVEDENAEWEGEPIISLVRNALGQLEVDD